MVKTFDWQKGKLYLGSGPADPAVSVMFDLKIEHEPETEVETAEGRLRVVDEAFSGEPLVMIEQTAPLRLESDQVKARVTFKTMSLKTGEYTFVCSGPVQY
ncbi:hypothetical protein H7849_02685 [Alloacidobacterium dinghuense]|uniref:Uncharacterized protein n=1 Tax=Alloacidobacterium dinghuense TaxID=2763107 RepID=A0A7G8BK47_9BACT|nr:hypothetical protein [Alloacidobacterium dinghuense]QNI32917.1 hypothetical protein H7849_02685 [Alloacidobacterium dinghuense]